jgi:GT2 family glycosyltransferase
MPHMWSILGCEREEPVSPVVNVLTPLAGDVAFEWVNNALKLDPARGYAKSSFHKGNPVDIARELLVDLAIKNKCDYLFFLDSDVIPPENILDVLIGHNLPIVCGIYNSKTPGMPWGMWNFNKTANTFLALDKWKKRLVQVDVTGCGCMLIKSDVILKMHEAYPDLPLFMWTKDRSSKVTSKLNVPDERMRGVSEDFWFCLLAAKCGFPIVIDTDMKCSHIGNMKVFDGKITGTEVT